MGNEACCASAFQPLTRGGQCSLAPRRRRDGMELTISEVRSPSAH